MSSQISLEYLNESFPTRIALSAINNSNSVISVILGGTPIYLPIKPYINGFDVNGANNVFTVKKSGIYFISYSINTTASFLMSSSVFINSNISPSLTRNPNLATNSFSAQTIVPLSKDDKIQLTLFGLIGSAILQGGQGAVMNVIKIY